MITTFIIKFLLSMFTILFNILESALGVLSLPFDLVSALNKILYMMATLAIYLKVLAPYTVSMLFKNAFLFFLVLVYYFFIKMASSLIPFTKKSL